jgi:hypothetical protein
VVVGGRGTGSVQVGLVAKVRQRPAGLTAHGGDGDAQQAGDLAVGEVLEVAQHQDRPLARSQPVQRPPQRVPVGVARGLVGGARLGQVSARDLAPPEAASPGDVGRHDDASQVRLGIAVDPGPGEPELDQRGLQHVLGGGPVPREQVRRA